MESNGSKLTGKVRIGIDENNTEIICGIDAFDGQTLIAGGNEFGYSAGITTAAQTLAEQLSDNGIPVVLTDADGDLPGLAISGTGDEAKAFPTYLWTALAGIGLRFNLSVSDLGETFLGNMLGLPYKYIIVASIPA